MLNIVAAIMISAASPASVTSSAVAGLEQVGSKMIPVLAPRNNGGVIGAIAQWFINNFS